MTTETSGLHDNFIPTLSMPWKLLRHKDAVVDGRIRPLHVKLNINSRCNAACPFCSVRETRNEDEELGSEELLELAKHFHSLGTGAFTICGNGEPTLHPGLDRFCERCGELGIQLGIITNGLLWSDAVKEVPAGRYLTWARMSIVDTESGRFDTERVRRFARNLPGAAVSAYFTVTASADGGTAEAIATVIEETHNCTHMKFVEDCVNGAPDAMDALERRLCGRYAKIAFQRWEKSLPGASPCLASKLRPVVNADGYVHPCCTAPLIADYRMVHWREYRLDTGPFDGSVCATCDWRRYNEVLAGLTMPLEHERFL